MKSSTLFSVRVRKRRYWIEVKTFFQCKEQYLNFVLACDVALKSWKEKVLDRGQNVFQCEEQYLILSWLVTLP